MELAVLSLRHRTSPRHSCVYTRMSWVCSVMQASDANSASVHASDNFMYESSDSENDGD